MKFVFHIGTEPIVTWACALRLKLQMTIKEPAQAAFRRLSFLGETGEHTSGQAEPVGERDVCSISMVVTGE